MWLVPLRKRTAHVKFFKHGAASCLWMCLIADDLQALEKHYNVTFSALFIMHNCKQKLTMPNADNNVEALRPLDLSILFVSKQCVIVILTKSRESIVLYTNLKKKKSSFINSFNKP